MTVSSLIDLYEAEGCFIQRGIRQGEPMKERTKAYTIARLRHHVVPLLGHKRVSEIGAGEIERFVRDVAPLPVGGDDLERLVVTGPRPATGHPGATPGDALHVVAVGCAQLKLLRHLSPPLSGDHCCASLARVRDLHKVRGQSHLGHRVPDRY